MTSTTILIIILSVLIIVITYISRRRDLKYEEKNVNETMSDTMRSIIRNERRENLAKKQRFEAQLAKADHAKIDVPSDKGPDSSKA